MPQFKRRHFLQSTGSFLAALGLSQLDIQHRGDNYAKVLAQSTRRKLALLVGINDYSKHGGLTNLYGAVNDVDLQRQLLINKFGFHPKDILRVTDAQATRKGILTAFEEHLIKQAKAGHVVVFHYSGHGTRVIDPDLDSPDKLNTALITHEAREGKERKVVQGIMGHTLFLLMYALQTENVTVVLDTCYAGGGFRGNFAVRASDQYDEITATEFEYQRQWLSQLNLSPQKFKTLRKAGIAKGVVIAGATGDQYAADTAFDGFKAGAFTYAMTQYLWQQTQSEPLGTVMLNVGKSFNRQSVDSSNSSADTRGIVGITSESISNNQNRSSNDTYQTPVYDIKPNSNNDKRPVYMVEQQMPPAEAFILGVDGDRAQVWLGGVNAKSLKAFDKGTVFNIIDPLGKQQGQLELESRSGLVGQGKLQGTAKPGNFLQEQMRGISSNTTLIIGLDPSLGNEIQIARSALEAIKQIEAVPLRQKEVQYILGRMTEAYYQDFQRQKIENIPAVGSVGLFTPGLSIIPLSFAEPSESVTKAIARLQAKLRSMLAVRIVKLTLNTNSSHVSVTALMTRLDTKKVVATIAPIRSSLTLGSAINQPVNKLPKDANKLPLGTRVQFQVTNNDNRELYVSILKVDPTGKMSVIFPNNWATSSEATRVKRGETLLVPDPNNTNLSLVIQEPKGLAEVLIIASTNPMRNSLQTLENITSPTETNRNTITIGEPVEIINNLLDDLAEGTRGSKSIFIAKNLGVKRIDTSQIAALSITFEII